MAHAGQVLDNGITRMEFVVTAAESDGALHEMRVTYQPQSPFPASHVHPAQEEHFEVVEGEMRFVVDGQERTVTAGQAIDVPRGAPHQARNPGTAPAVVIWQTRPALRTGEFFEALHAARDDRTGQALGAVFTEYTDVFALAQQP